MIKEEKNEDIAKAFQLGLAFGFSEKYDETDKIIDELKKGYEDRIAGVLDKIRAEIEQKCCITVGQENEPAITLHDVFEIIDKYREGK